MLLIISNCLCISSRNVFAYLFLLTLPINLIADDNLPRLLTLKPPSNFVNSSELGKLKAERFAVAMRELEVSYGRLKTSSNSDIVLEYSNRMHDICTRLIISYEALKPTADEKISLYKDIVDIMKRAESFLKAYNNSGLIRNEDLDRIKFYRITNEINLMELQIINK